MPAPTVSRDETSSSPSAGSEEGSLPSHAIRGSPQMSEPELRFLKREIRQLLVTVRGRTRAEHQTIRRVRHRAMAALVLIVEAIRNHPGTGQSRRLVRFVAGCYNGSDYPFDLTELRGLDTCLANACLDYLDYDRLAIREIHHHLPGGEGTLHQWLYDYGVLVGVRREI